MTEVEYLDKVLIEVKRKGQWCPTTIYQGLSVHGVINVLPAWVKRRGVDFDDVRVKRLRTKDELLKAENDILWWDGGIL